jgi:hypothetical protein
MKLKEKRKLDRILSAKRGLSVQEKEDIHDHLSRHYKESFSKPGPLSKRYLIPAAVGSALAAGIILLVMYFSQTPSDFVARGSLTATNRVKLTCLRKGPQTDRIETTDKCRQNDSLVFEVQGRTGMKYFSAAALSPQGLLIWYFPSNDQSSLKLEKDGPTRRAIELDSKHRPGSYRIYGLFTKEKSSKDALRKLIEDDNYPDDAVVLELNVGAR